MAVQNYHPADVTGQTKDVIEVVYRDFPHLKKVYLA